MSDQIYDHRPQQCWFDASLIKQDGVELGSIGIAIYCVLLTYAPNPCPSQATIASQLGCTVPTVRKYLQKLHSLGWIRIEVDFDADTKTYSNNKYHLLNRGGVVKEVYQGGKGGLQESCSSSGDKELPAFRLFELAFGYSPTPMNLDKMDFLLEQYSYEWVKEALEITADNGKRLSYTEGILRNWKDKGKDTPKPDPIADYVDPAYRGVRKQY